MALPTASDNPFPSILITEGSEPAAPAAGKQRMYIDSTTHHWSRTDSSGVERDIEGRGRPVIVVPQGISIADAGTIGANATNATAQMARSAIVSVPFGMTLRSLWLHVVTNGSGAVQWGLYDFTTSRSAAVEVATGSAAPGGTGWREIAATGAPVTVQPGTYLLIIQNPASNASTIGINTAAGGSASMFFRAWGTYTWDTTPDVASASWTDSSIMYTCFLEGDLDGSATRL